MDIRIKTPRNQIRPARLPLIILLAAAACFASVAGCGVDKKKTSAARTTPSRLSEPVATVASAPQPAPRTETKPEPAPASSAAVGTYAATTQENSTRDSKLTQVPDGSLPPDLVATISASQVTPGEILEITAKGSSDVVEMTLADGIGEAQPFTYDQVEGVWRTRYRAPMRFPSERLGLSVTATNGEDHWRRVWIFIEPKPETVEGDSLIGR